KLVEAVETGSGGEVQGRGDGPYNLDKGGVVVVGQLGVGEQGAGDWHRQKSLPKGEVADKVHILRGFLLPGCACGQGVVAEPAQTLDTGAGENGILVFPVAQLAGLLFELVFAALVVAVVKAGFELAAVQTAGLVVGGQAQHPLDRKNVV